MVGVILTLEKYEEKVKIIEEGLQAEERIITYADTLITATNPREEPQEARVPDPHPCSISYLNLTEDQLEQDYAELINCCQRHSCRLEGNKIVNI